VRWHRPHPLRAVSLTSPRRADRSQNATKTTHSDLQNSAIERYEAFAAIVNATIGCPDERVHQLAVLARTFGEHDECNLVRVEAIVPRCRMGYRRRHFRFRYVADGKQVSEATARTLVEG
jgi:hypothetical protein